MTLACGQCTRYLGEKCSSCGSTELNVHPSPLGEIFFYCMNCKNVFRSGNDGITTGICNDCELKAQLELQK